MPGHQPTVNSTTLWTRSRHCYIAGTTVKYEPYLIYSLMRHRCHVNVISTCADADAFTRWTCDYLSANAAVGATERTMPSRRENGPET